MTLEEVVAGCEEAWQFFSGVFRVVVPDNMSPVVDKADAVNPQLTANGWSTTGAGFRHRPSRVVIPGISQGQAGMKFVQGNFFAGESFLDLADARSKMAAWLGTANTRVHGTTGRCPRWCSPGRRRRACCRFPPGGTRFVLGGRKVHVDYHIQVDRALYSVPWRQAGARVMARADEHLVKMYLRDQLIKTHTRKHPGGRSTDAADMPQGVEGYATRSVDCLVAQAACYGESTGTTRGGCWTATLCG